MAKLYFRHGAMNSGKTTALLMTAHNYKSQGKPVLILKPDLDTRNGVMGAIVSRALNKAQECAVFGKEDNLYDMIETCDPRPDAVLVDEAQFMTAAHARQLALVVAQLNVPVIAYGLRCRYTDGELFEGTAALLYWADTIEETKTVCQYCGAKATKNLLRINGVPQYTGDAVVMGDVEGDTLVYAPVCLEHYISPPNTTNEGS